MARADDLGPTLRVYLEAGARRTFAMAVDWPGWGRAGRGEEAAVDALLAYRDRYAVVARAAGLELPGGAGGPAVDVLARMPGNATTDFGAPGVVPALDGLAWTPPQPERQVALLVAAWARFDEITHTAPAELRKGPRGGGRDRDAIVEHVLGTEPAYARKAGLRVPAARYRDDLDATRAQLLELLTASPGPAGTASGWPAPYAVRRIAWHALDHAWEIEDRA